MVVSVNWGRLYKSLASAYNWTPDIVSSMSLAQVCSYLDDNRPLAPPQVVTRRMKDKHA